jgi:hypothetical protein
MTDADAAMAAALESEEVIALEAAEIRDKAEQLTASLLAKLFPLLRRPLPGAFIQYIGAVEGKPYESTGVRSVQVQIDRLNNVLGPAWWWDSAEYADGGKLCTVTVYVGNPANLALSDERGGIVLAHRTATGGVQRGTGLGNLYKGSYTNAAKRAFAALGPGHEVYLGAADLDPDVNAEVAAAQDAAGAEVPTIGKTIAKKMVDRVWLVDGLRTKLQLAASHVAQRDVGVCDTKAHATTALATLNYGEAERLSTWIDQKQAKGADKPEAEQPTLAPGGGKS